MAKFDITVKNNVTGKEKTFSADMYMMQTKEQGASSVLAMMEGAGNDNDATKLIMAMDDIKKRIFKNHPGVELMYLLKDHLYSDGGMVDMSDAIRMMEEQQ